MAVSFRVGFLKTNIRRLHIGILLALYCLGAAACAFRPDRPAPGSSETPFYRPPTLLPSATPSPEATLPPAQPTQPADCKDGLKFLADLTIDDGTLVKPGSLLDKRWQVENSGSCNWDERYRLRLIAGDDLGAEKSQALYPARSSSQAVIRIEFVAPAEPGPYRSAWQATNPQGELFGDPIYIDIIVE